jgi:hypothetical protein
MRPAKQTQPLLLAADAPFAAAVEAIPAEDATCGGLVQDLGGWQNDHAEKDLEESQSGGGQDAPACRNSAVVCFSRSFWCFARNGTFAEKLQIVIKQLPLMTAGAASAHSSCPVYCNVKGARASFKPEKSGKRRG